MYALLKKEIHSIFHSLSIIIFPGFFLLICGSLLWLIPGNYNIPENGYASLSSFFSLTSIIFLILIPALSMQTFAEEKKHGTLSLLYTRPIALHQIIVAKYIAVLVAILVALLPTLLYVLSISIYAIPEGNIDWGGIAGSYLGLIILASCLISISVFASCLTSNQVLAFIIGLLISACFFYGFDLLALFADSGKAQYYIKQMGFLSHYQTLQKGIISLSDTGYLIAITLLFLSLSSCVLRPNLKRISYSFSLFICLLILSSNLQFKWDLTADKRYTISDGVKSFLKELKTPVKAKLYLSGDLNAGFFSLRQSCTDMLDEFVKLSSGNFSYKIINPYQKNDNQGFESLEEKGIKGIAVNEKNREGKIIQQVIFPWILLQANEKELPVSLLVNEPGVSGEENLNMSIESLEYHLAVGLKTITNERIRKIVFLQGHDEPDESGMENLFDALSYNYQIDLGDISEVPNIDQLKDYELIVIASPQKPYSEHEKYLLDQYIMYGGKVLWIINGAKLDMDIFREAGLSPSMPNEVNLNDLLFGYGIRINPVFLKDLQCSDIPIRVSTTQAGDDVLYAPWYFSPILNVTPDLMITKGISFVSTEFASTISFVGHNSTDRKRQVLLFSSDHSRTVDVPGMISLDEINRLPDKKYFNQKNLPVAALLEGNFLSGFRNRPAPEGIFNHVFKDSVANNKMIVIASENIIKDDIGNNKTAKSQTSGDDTYSGKQFANSDFILNAVSYLTDDPDISVLKTKDVQLRLLDKNKLFENQNTIILFNVILPPILLVIFFLTKNILRRRKYRKF